MDSTKHGELGLLPPLVLLVWNSLVKYKYGGAESVLYSAIYMIER